MSIDAGKTRAARIRRVGGGRAWAGDPPHAAAARERLVEAAARCIAREGSMATTVGAIASEAGVSRQTVYRYFKGRDEIVLRAIRAAAEDVRSKVDRAMGALSDPADMIVEAVVLGLAELRGDPVLGTLLDPSGVDASITSRITTLPGIEWAREAFAVAIDAAGWDEAEADSALELVLRVFLSLVVSPSPERSPDELRAFLYRHLVPGLGLGMDEAP